MRILGIDPGSRATGYGVVERSEAGIAHVAHGTVRPPAHATLPDRLHFLYQALRDVAQRYAPDLAVVEQVFVALSARAALVLGQARGVAVAALAAGGLAVNEIAARQAKKAVVGTGAASKAQVQEMVQRLLDLERRPGSDAADALAAAIAYAHSGRLGGLAAFPRRGRRRQVSIGRSALRRSF